MLRYRYIPDRSKKTPARSQSEERPLRRTCLTPIPTSSLTVQDVRYPSATPPPPNVRAMSPPPLENSRDPSSTPFRRTSSSTFSSAQDLLIPAPKGTTATSSPRTPRRSASSVASAPATATSSPKFPRRAPPLSDDGAATTGRCVEVNGVQSDSPWEAEVLLDSQGSHRLSGSSPCPSEPGAESIMYGHHTSRRRKKRPMGHGFKNVQVSRGRSGYGFTISGQHPCVLSCIVGGSPADLAGLKAGDYLYFVNGVNVSHAPHDDVVRMVGQSTGTLDLQVAENYNSSDSSEDDYPPRSKSRYPNRVRFRQSQGHGVAKGGIASRPLPQRPVDNQVGHGRAHRNHMPVGADSDLSTSVTSPGSSLSEDRSRHDYSESMYGWKRPVYERIGRHFNSQSKVTDSSTTDMSGEGLAFTMATVQNGPVISTAKISSAVPKRPPSRSQDLYLNHTNNQQSNPSSAATSSSLQGAVGGATGGAPVEQGAVVELAEEEEDVIPEALENEARAIVGYIGSIELPGNLNRPNQRLQQLRNAVRRLRVEQKIHTLVLMEVDSSGVRLSNRMGGTVAHYTVDKLAFSGICPDDKRFFGIVTLNTVSDDVSEFSGNVDGSPSSSCHVFMVDPDMCSHVLHTHKASAFNLVCTPIPNSHQCREFPHSPTHLILCIANLYRDRPRSKLDSDIIQSHAFTDPSRPAQRSSSNSSNSDSGLGFGREEPQNEQVCVVDMQEEAAGTGAQAMNGAVAPRSNTPSTSVSRSLGSLQHLSPGIYPFNTPRGLHRPMSAFEVRRGLNNSSSSEECWIGHSRIDKLTPRAMPDPATRHLARATSTDGLERNPSAENLRQSMQRLLQARQQQLQQEQAVSSDSESQVSSNVQGSQAFSSRSAFQVPRPVSAPLRSRGRHQQAEMIDMGFGKLSPRAFQQPSSVIRSPSAPPIPYFPHQDPDEDEDDTESEDDPFVRTIISQFNRDRVLDFGDENPRRFSEGYALGKQREKERAEREELQKWTKTGSFRRTHNMKLKGNISQSHESLAVGEGDCGSPSQKLVGANSVNSIITAHNTVEEEAGRVAGWAVGFPRLLADTAGLSIFTEFLKKEFSEENIIFWSAVEVYRHITDDDLRRNKAQEIYTSHLGSQANDPVNVDSTARRLAEQYLDNPTPNMFDVAQQQIFQLMRTDSYSRFLKSDLYKGHLMREMEGQPLSLPNSGSAKTTQPDTKKKGKGKENEEKRRKSLLPWRQNKKSSLKESKGKGKDKEEGGKDSKGKGKDKEEKKDKEMKKGPGPGIDLSTMRKEVFQPSEQTEKAESGEVKFCRVVMPDTSTTVVCTRAGLNIRTVLGKLCDKRSLSIASVDVFLLGSDKPLDLEEDISTLGSKEVVIERRVLFRLDLPNHKSIGVKAKPNRSIRDVFKPILNKYGHRIDSCGVQLSGLSEFLDLDKPVSDLDNQRVIVIANPENAENNIGHALQQPVSSRHRRTPLLHLPSRSRGAGGKGGSLEEITNQIFDDLMKGKSELAHAFDELGVVDLERGGKGHKNPDEHRSLGLFGLLRKESWGAKDTTKQKNKGRVTFALPRSDSKKNKAAKAEEERFMEELARTHSQQLEEERTVSNSSSVPGFLAADCVETVDMAHPEAGLGLDLSEDVVGAVVDSSLLPPPDMFDDVHYMHSGSADDTHLSDMEDNGDLDDVPAALPLSARSVPRLSTFGTPRLKVGLSGGKPASKGTPTPSAERTNPYLSMQPVIVDSKSSRKDNSHSRLDADLQTLGETVSPHFDNVQSFRPTRGQTSPSHKAPVASPEKFSSETSREQGNGKSASEIPKDPLRPIPARRRLLDNAVSGVRSDSPRTAKPDVRSSVPSEITSPRQSQSDTNSRISEMVSPRVTSPRVDTEHVRASPSRQSPKTGSLGDVNYSTSSSTPSPTQPSSSASLVPPLQHDGTPRYTPPPPYATAVGHRQGVPSKSSPSPTYSAGRPFLSSVNHLVQPSKRNANAREPSSQETPRNVVSSVQTLEKMNEPLSSREMYETSGNSLSSFKPKEITRNISPYDVSKTPRESMEGREPPTPRNRSHFHGTKPDSEHHLVLPGAVVTPRDRTSPYDEARHFTQQGQEINRNSASWDPVAKEKNSLMSPRQSSREGAIGTPRNNHINGSVPFSSSRNTLARGYHSHVAVNSHNPLSPREPASQRSQSMETFSPRQKSQTPGGRGLNSSTVIVADVHHSKDHQTNSDVHPISRPLSGMFDGSYSEQTVTFV